MIQGSQGATALVGIPEFVVGTQELVDGEWWLYVETSADLMGCPSCGTRAVGHGRRTTLVRDLPIGGRPTVLVWAKRRWCCPDGDCERRSWYEVIDSVARRASMTERARERLAHMVNVDSIAAAGAEFGVGWHTANQCVADYTDPVIDDPARLDGVYAIGVDEKRFLNATPEHRTTFTTQVLDLDRRRVLDVIEGKSRDVLGAWLAQRGEGWCEQILLATLDPAAGYRRALLDHLPNATLVVDHFHAIRLAMFCEQRDRQRSPARAERDTRAPGPQARPAVPSATGVLTGFERLSDDRVEWMMAMLAEGDPEGHVGGRSWPKSS